MKDFPYKGKIHENSRRLQEIGACNRLESIRDLRKNGIEFSIHFNFAKIVKLEIGGMI